MKAGIVLLLILAVAGGGWYGYDYWQKATGPGSSYKTTELKRAELIVTIAATGTVEPEEVVDVGAQVAGKIEYFGEDPRGNGKFIDYNSPVEKGTILAHIDDSLYAADVAQGEAQLESANANVLRAKADLEQLKAKLVQAERNWNRAKELGPSKALSATDYDNYKATYETAKASVAVGEASIVQAERAVEQAKASLRRCKRNLEYCTITSPVKGVIIARRVNIGQTVVASLNAPSLFLIAKDLTRMQVWAAVNEADIGSIYPGQPVTFTVDKYPDETFYGQVGKIRLNATMTQNVVTYTVEINTDNSDGRLLPYLTANVLFEVARKPDVLLAPTSALRWMPSPMQVAPDVRKEFQATPPKPRRIPPPSSGRGGAGRGATSRPSKPVERDGKIWVQDGLFVRPVPVKVGMSDGVNTEIRTDKLSEGDVIVVGDAPKGGGNDTTNPFTPQLFGGGGRRPG